ncbi:DUF4298 domain-containing protein [Streptococcus himalayensis]|nr:DUF4298 domain-containing protein [Streptococcus himalayensis]
MKKELNTIQIMEAIANRAAAVFEQLESSLAAFEDLEEDFARLLAYYESDWRKHYEMDNEGKFPSDMPRGVLGEDTIYNLIVSHHELLAELKRLGEREE